MTNKYSWSAAADKRREERRPKPKPHKPLPPPKNPLARSTKPIAKRSIKLKRGEALHAKIKRTYLMEHSICECNINDCQRAAVDVHHKKGRVGSLLNDVRFFLPVSRECHTWIETHPKEAAELGLSISRFKK